MPFKKGHTGYNKGKQRKPASTAKNTTKEWEKMTIARTLDPEEVYYYLENNLDVMELYDKLKDAKRDKKEYQKNWYNKNKKK